MLGKKLLSGFIFQGYHLFCLAGEGGVGGELVDGADEKKEMATDLYGTLTALLSSIILEGCQCDIPLACSHAI